MEHMFVEKEFAPAEREKEREKCHSDLLEAPRGIGFLRSLKNARRGVGGGGGGGGGSFQSFSLFSANRARARDSLNPNYGYIRSRREVIAAHHLLAHSKFART